MTWVPFQVTASVKLTVEPIARPGSSWMRNGVAVTLAPGAMSPKDWDDDESKVAPLPTVTLSVKLVAVMPPVLENVGASWIVSPGFGTESPLPWESPKFTVPKLIVALVGGSGGLVMLSEPRPMTPSL